MQPLRVNTAGLQKRVSQYEVLAGKLSGGDSPPVGSGLGCQASTAAIATLLADAVTARAALAARVRATATAVSAGGAAYDGQDADGASALAQQVV